MLSYLKTKLFPSKKSSTEIANAKLVNDLFSQIIKNSHYDSKTNTLVISSPTNIVFKSSGSIINIAEAGYIINVADEIHLNPELSEQTMINIRKLGKNFDEVVEPISKSIEVVNGSLSV